jgi:hypothetical protein
MGVVDFTYMECLRIVLEIYCSTSDRLFIDDDHLPDLSQMDNNNFLETMRRDFYLRPISDPKTR